MPRFYLELNVELLKFQGLSEGPCVEFNFIIRMLGSLLVLAVGAVWGAPLQTSFSTAALGSSGSSLK